MCGIVGYVGPRPAVDVLLRGLKRLEYRGYDSTGVAWFHDGKLVIKKSEGKLENVERLLENGSHADARCGIGHTRWATHGKPTTQNAHPHRTGHVALVANGIIENYLEIRGELQAKGHRPVSETDSELFGFLVMDEMDRGVGLAEAVRRSFRRIHGQCSVVIVSEKEPGVVVGVRNGSPLVAARDPKGGAILASDAQPILDYASDVVFLEQGDLVVGTEGGVAFSSLETGKPLDRAPTRIQWTPDQLEKNGYPHFMLKEIHEQPTALVDTLNGLMDRTDTEAFRLAAQPGVGLLEAARELTIVACGSSWHAALLGKYWMEKWAKIPTNVELASEYRYREPVQRPGNTVIAITQSGETADTLAVIREMRRIGVPTIGLTNVRGSTVTREADATFFTHAGPEVGVAATKTFLTQSASLLLWSLHLACRRGTYQGAESLFSQFVRIPHILERYLSVPAGMTSHAKRIAVDLAAKKGVFFIGRGYAFPIALEGALKLKEIAYLHAEGYAGGELKHGPIAMIDSDLAVVVLAPPDRWREKTISNLEEIRARGARTVVIGGHADEALRRLSDHFVPLPDLTQIGRGILKVLAEELFPLLTTPVVQLLSYEIAVIRGTDVDKPRNLAKSVTVE